MERLDFVGSAIFIPAFLVSIGLNIDPALLFDLETIALALLFTSFVVVGKGAAAVITGLTFRFTWNEIGLMSSLSFGQAASTLAIAQVGFSLGMFGQEVVDAAVLAIVTTALITSYGTRFFINRVPRPVAPPALIGESVLVDVRPEGSDLRSLMAFAGAVAGPDDGLVIPFAIPEPGHRDEARTVVDEAAAAAAEFGPDSDGAIRVDDSFVEGTLSLAEESDSSLVILSWSGPRFTTDYIVGNEIDAVGERSRIPTAAVRILRMWERIVIVTGDVSLDWQKEDALTALAAMRRMRRSIPTPLVVVTPERDFVDGRIGEDEAVDFVTEKRARQQFIESLTPTDLVVFPAHVLHDMPPVRNWRLARHLREVNLMVIAGPHRLSISRGATRPVVTTGVHVPA